MNLQIALWSTPEEDPKNFIEATSRFSGLTFSTLAQGGFGDASFTVQVSGWNAVKWYRAYLNFHVVIFDHLGRRLYEGRIEDTEATTEGVNVTCLGYYATAQELHSWLYYPDNVTGSQLVSDAIDIVSEKTGAWLNDTSMVQELLINLAPLDFMIDKKIQDMLTAACKYGDGGLIPKPMYFGLWENRRPYFIAEPDVTSEATWRLYIKDFSSSQGLSLSRSRSNVWNRIQAVYDDPLIGGTFTDYADDPDSQRLFGLKEGSISVGSAPVDVANLARDLAIKAYANPEQSSKISVQGRVYTRAGAPDYPYMVRAGSMMQVMDYDPSVGQLVGGTSGVDSAVAFISRTTYKGDDNSIDLELGRKNVALDLLLAKIGVNSGSVS